MDFSETAMILIIGGSGFIGTRLCKRLWTTKSNFSIIDKQISKTFPEKCSEIDICDREKFLSFECDTDVLVNLAAEHRDDVSPKSLYDQVNVQGARHVCDYAELRDIKTIIFTSSVAVYGFAERGTDELGAINPFNDYGRTKYEAEQIYKQWQAKDPQKRSLTIIRPTVVFGEQNRGNVFNLFNQIASGRFVMVGNGKNRKSMAYVENVAAFLQHSLTNTPGIHTYNYIDKPDFDMNTLVCKVKSALDLEPKVGISIPYFLGLLAGFGFDIIAKLTNRSLPISSIRIQKFCKDSTYNTSLQKTGFNPPVILEDAISRTIWYEFIQKVDGEVFYSE